MPGRSITKYQQCTASFGGVSSYNVKHPTDDHREDEGSLGKHIASSNAVDRNGHSVGEIQPHDGGGNDSVEGAGRVSK